MKYLVFFIAIIWVILCAPIALISFYIKECLQLSDIISSNIDDFLKRYK